MTLIKRIQHIPKLSYRTLATPSVRNSDVTPVLENLSLSATPELEMTSATDSTNDLDMSLLELMPVTGS